LPYPFAPLPTFAELCQILQDEFGCELKTHETLVLNIGDSYPVTYLERDMDGEILTVSIVLPENRQERIELDFLRSITQRLRLDPSRFGLDLDIFEEDDEKED